jgi:hypothetical protein
VQFQSGEDKEYRTVYLSSQKWEEEDEDVDDDDDEEDEEEAAPRYCSNCKSITSKGAF